MFDGFVGFPVNSKVNVEGNFLENIFFSLFIRGFEIRVLLPMVDGGDPSIGKFFADLRLTDSKNMLLKRKFENLLSFYYLLS